MVRLVYIGLNSEDEDLSKIDTVYHACLTDARAALARDPRHRDF